MGVGKPPELLEAIARGIDLFDCVLPTREGRRGHLYTHDGVVRIGGREHEESEEPLDPDCPCEVCRRCSRAWLRHLFAVGEHTAVTLGTLHNLTFFVDLVKRARAEILAGDFDAFRRAFAERYDAGERRWRERRSADPHGARGSRRSREEQRARARRLDDRP
jgi:queuine tRNA-ribosyltransferase